MTARTLVLLALGGCTGASTGETETGQSGSEDTDTGDTDTGDTDTGETDRTCQRTADVEGAEAIEASWSAWPELEAQILDEHDGDVSEVVEDRAGWEAFLAARALSDPIATVDLDANDVAVHAEWDGTCDLPTWSLVEAYTAAGSRTVVLGHLQTPDGETDCDWEYVEALYVVVEAIEGATPLEVCIERTAP